MSSCVRCEDTRRGRSGVAGLVSAPHESSCLIITRSLASCQSHSAQPTAQSASMRSPHSSILESSPNLLPCPCPAIPGCLHPPVPSLSPLTLTCRCRPSQFPPQIFPNCLVLDTGLKDTDLRQETWRPQSRALDKAGAGHKYQVQC